MATVTCHGSEGVVKADSNEDSNEGSNPGSKSKVEFEHASAWIATMPAMLAGHAPRLDTGDGMT